MKYLLVVVFSILASPCQMKEVYKMRLIGSSLQYAGQVQINISGSHWTSICDVGWDMKDARVVCRQLNYFTAEAAILGEAFGHAPGHVLAKEFHCLGNESSLSDCRTSESKNTTCGKNQVAAVLCNPNVRKQHRNSDSFPAVVILISLVGCLAFTSIIILIVTCKAMFTGKNRCRVKEREIGLSNAIIERDIDACSSAEGKRELNESGNSVSSGSFSNFEDVENITCSVQSVKTNNKKMKTQDSKSNAELIESTSNLEARHSDIDQEVVKRKESRGEKYMPLLKGSRAFLHFYEKLLKRNKNRQSATDIDCALDYYSSDQYGKDWLTSGNSADIDISSDEEYNKIYPKEEQDQGKVDNDKSGSEYVPMLSLSLMHSRELAVSEETPQGEYLDILPPDAPSKEKSLPGSSKRDSDYLHPVEVDLPAFPRMSDDMASGSYDEELPRPPQDLATWTNNNREKDNKCISHSESLGLSNQRCRCEKEKDFMCKICLDRHVKQKIVDQEQKADELDYVPMVHCSGEKDNRVAEKNLQRNSAEYTIPPMKPPKEIRKEHGSFPEELNKKILNRKIKNGLFQSCDNEKLSNDAQHLEKAAKPDVSPTPSFSRTKYLFENNKAVSNSLGKTEKMAAFSKRVFNPEESESTGIPIPTSRNAEKPRSESCSVESTNGAKPSASFIEALENALKASGVREGTDVISDETDIENKYELDYENIHSSRDESTYENNDISSGSRPASCEYDYVHEKQRKSLHFYEAVSKQSEESEEDQYENI